MLHQCGTAVARLTNQLDGVWRSSTFLLGPWRLPLHVLDVSYTPDSNQELVIRLLQSFNVATCTHTKTIDFVLIFLFCVLRIFASKLIRESTLTHSSSSYSRPTGGAENHQKKESSRQWSGASLSAEQTELSKMWFLHQSVSVWTGALTLAVWRSRMVCVFAFSLKRRTRSFSWYGVHKVCLILLSLTNQNIVANFQTRFISRWCSHCRQGSPVDCRKHRNLPPSLDDYGLALQQSWNLYLVASYSKGVTLLYSTWIESQLHWSTGMLFWQGI